MAAKKSFSEVLRYPLGLWALFYTGALVAGLAAFPLVPAEMMLSTGAMILAVPFGIWIGAKSAKSFGKTWVSVLTAFMAVIVIGFLGVLFSSVLVEYAPSYLAYVSPYTSQSQAFQSIVMYAVGAWLEIIMVALASAGMAAEFLLKG